MDCFVTLPFSWQAGVSVSEPEDCYCQKCEMRMRAIYGRQPFPERAALVPSRQASAHSPCEQAHQATAASETDTEVPRLLHSEGRAVSPSLSTQGCALHEHVPLAWGPRRQGQALHKNQASSEMPPVFQGQPLTPLQGPTPGPHWASRPVKPLLSPLGQRPASGPRWTLASGTGSPCGTLSNELVTRPSLLSSEAEDANAAEAGRGVQPCAVLAGAGGAAHPRAELPGATNTARSAGACSKDDAGQCGLERLLSLADHNRQMAAKRCEEFMEYLEGALENGQGRLEPKRQASPGPLHATTTAHSPSRTPPAPKKGTIRTDLLAGRPRSYSRAPRHRSCMHDKLRAEWASYYLCTPPRTGAHGNATHVPT